MCKPGAKTDSIFSSEIADLTVRGENVKDNRESVNRS